MRRSDEDEHPKNADAAFRPSDADLAVLKQLAAAELRDQLAKAEPQFIRSAAPAILALERLPRPTAGVQVRLGYQTPNRDGNYGWADIALSEEDIEASVGEHF